MNDEKMKEIFQKDHSTPERPLGEWNRIQGKIAEERNSFRFFPQIAVSVFALTLVMLGLTVQQNFKQKSDDELAQYLFSENYFADEDLSFYNSDYEL